LHDATTAGVEVERREVITFQPQQGIMLTPSCSNGRVHPDVAISLAA